MSEGACNYNTYQKRCDEMTTTVDFAGCGTYHSYHVGNVRGSVQLQYISEEMRRNDNHSRRCRLWHLPEHFPVPNLSWYMLRWMLER